MRVAGEGTPFYPELILWLELPKDAVVYTHLQNPDAPDVSFKDSLMAAMESPLVGPPRKPGRIRVADRSLADAVQSVLPEAAVVVGPTPELDHFVNMMTQKMSAGDETELSYLEGGSVSEKTVAEFFQAAETLYRVAPWKKMTEVQPVRVDIPALDVREACFSVAGSMGESQGLFLFGSIDDFEFFFSEKEDDEENGPGVPFLALEFSNATDLPPLMKKEAARHGWPVASVRSYPRIHSIDRNGIGRPLTDLDYFIFKMICAALPAFVLKHGALFESDEFEPISESYFNAEDQEVRFTAPAWSGDLFEANDDTEVLDVADASDPTALHDLDGRLEKRLLRFSESHPDQKWMKALPVIMARDSGGLALIAKWVLYNLPAKGGAFAERYVDANGDLLSPGARDWVRAQSRAWLSIWEVREIEAGKRMILRDLLSGEEREVLEKGATQTLSVNQAILARVADWQDFSLLCGCHQSPLPPLEADAVVRAVQKKLKRKKNATPDMLREVKIGRLMIELWSEAVSEHDIALQTPPRLVNAGGEELLFTSDYFEFAGKDRKKIEKALNEIPEFLPPEEDDPDKSWDIFEEPFKETPEFGARVLGRICFERGMLKLETNSMRRADEFRGRLESTLGKMVKHRIREHQDPIALMKEAKEAKEAKERGPGGNAGGKPPPEESARLIRAFKEKHYESWIDESIPALDGKTPRQMARTKSGKSRVALLIQDMELSDEKLAPEERFDFNTLRKKLGIPI